MYIDSHTHFDLMLEKENSEESIFDEMRKAEVSDAVQISIDPAGFSWAFEFARRNRDRGVLFSLGIHPSSRAADNDIMELKRFSYDVVDSKERGLLFGIGECGLDYYRMRQKKEMQRASFEAQISLAGELSLPLIVHSRDAMDDTLSILKNGGHEFGIMHCFPGNKKAAKRVLDLGFYLSFAGNVTYNRALDLHESAAYAPSDRILVETDAPFLTPVPHRGKKNSPALIKHTYSYIADLRNVSVEKLAEQVRQNFLRIKQRNK